MWPGIRASTALAAMLQWLKSLVGVPCSAENVGDWGERCAAEWLRRERGFRIVARNWRNPADRREEIDLVARDEGVLVFVEVKARGADALVPGYFAVNERKRRVLRRAIRCYLQQLPAPPVTFRFDIVEVTVSAHSRQPPEILHFENVPLFPKHFRGSGKGEGTPPT